LQIEVSARHDSITEAMKAYAEKKAQRTLKYYDRIQSIHVILDVDGDSRACEMIARLEHTHDIVSTARDPDMRAAVDQAADRLDRQISEHKDRVRNRKGRGPNPHQPTRT